MAQREITTLPHFLFKRYLKVTSLLEITSEELDTSLFDCVRSSNPILDVVLTTEPRASSHSLSKTFT